MGDYAADVGSEVEGDNAKGAVKRRGCESKGCAFCKELIGWSGEAIEGRGEDGSREGDGGALGMASAEDRGGGCMFSEG